MTERVSVGNLRVAQVLYDFITNEALPGTGVDPDGFWAGSRQGRRRPQPAEPGPAGPPRRAAGPDRQVAPAPRHRAVSTPASIPQFLADIGYLLPEPAAFTITTSNVDDEITTTGRAAAGGPGPQRPLRAQRRQRPLGQPLRRPLRHRRHRRSAGAEPGTGYDTVRGGKVIAYARAFLDQAVPLATGSQPTPPAIRRRGALRRAGRRRSPAWPTRSSSSAAAARSAPRRSVLLVNHGLHIEILIDRGIRSARTTRPASPTWCWRRRSPPSMDCEDSVAAVDAEDKVAGLPQLARPDASGDLADRFTKGGKHLDPRCSTATAPTPRPDGRQLDPARPQPAVRPQRRPPDDQRRDRRRRRQRGVRRHPRRRCSPP